jgi:hypothetical protein
MNYLNVDQSDLRKPEFVSADLAQRGAWFSLLSWSAAVENGGKIIGARAWNEKMWVQACGLTLKILRQTCGLWAWDGEDLVLWSYPIEQEKAVQASRINGLKGGRPKINNHPVNPSDNHPVNPSDNHPENLKGKERKGIGMEGEGNGTGLPPPVEFPDGFPESKDRAVAWVRGSMLAPDAPDEAIHDIWAQVVGRGFKDAAGARVMNWAPWFHSFWKRAGGSWLEQQARRAVIGGIAEKEKGAAGGPKFKAPRWPWRLVALRVLEWVYAPEVQWHDLDLDSRRQIKAGWDALSPKGQADLLAEAGEGQKS